MKRLAFLALKAVLLLGPFPAEVGAVPGNGHGNGNNGRQSRQQQAR